MPAVFPVFPGRDATTGLQQTSCLQLYSERVLRWSHSIHVPHIGVLHTNEGSGVFVYKSGVLHTSVGVLEVRDTSEVL